MNRLLIVPGIALLAGGLYLFISDSDKPGGAKPGMSISLGEPKPIGSSEIGTTTVTDAVEFEVIPVDLSSEIESSGEEIQARVVASDEGDLAQTDLPVQTGSSETLASSDDGDADEVPVVAEVESESIESDQQQASNFTEHEITIDSSLYSATNDAGLSANQTARIGKIIEPYLDARSELRKGDKLIVTLDPAAGEAENDADQIHRLEYRGARKTFDITRVAGSLSAYEIGGGGSVERNDEASLSSTVVDEAPQQREEPAEASAATDNDPAMGSMKRAEGVVSVSFFSAAREAGLNAGQVEKIRKILTPYINFNREMRKGDRFVVILDDGEVHSFEYIGALKQLRATRDSQGAYKVTDKAGADITIAESADASDQTQNSKSKLPVITQSKSLAKGDAKIRIKSGENSRGESKTTAKVARVEQSKSQAKLPIKQRETNMPAEKIAGAKTSSSRQIRVASPKRSDTEKTRKQIKAKRPFWKNLGLGSSKVAGNNWKPKDRKLVKVFDKVAVSGKVEKKALVRAFKYYQENKKASGLAQTHIAIADYTKLASTKRLHIINLTTARVTSVQVAHGRKSGPIGGRVTSTSNANGSNKTTKGFYRVGTKEGRTNKKGLPYLSVQGLESHNRLVGLPPRKGGRDIIIHTAGYVASGGRSLGCFSIRPQDKRLVFNKLKGVLFYSYVG